jgi:hypothetical protein
MNCMVYVFFIATCEPNLYLFIDSDVNFACSFYNNYKFLVAQNILCTPWPRNPLTSSRLQPRPQAASATIFLSEH